MDARTRQVLSLTLAVRQEKNLAGRPLNGYYRCKGEDMNIGVDREEIGPRMLARIAKRTGLTPEDLCFAEHQPEPSSVP